MSAETKVIQYPSGHKRNIFACGQCDYFPCGVRGCDVCAMPAECPLPNFIDDTAEKINAVKCAMSKIKKDSGLSIPEFKKAVFAFCHEMKYGGCDA